MTHDGLFVDLEPYESHIFRFALDPETEGAAQIPEMVM
jgi:hypothetical protein